MEQHHSQPPTPEAANAKREWSTPRLHTEGKVIEVTLQPLGSSRG